MVLARFRGIVSDGCTQGSLAEQHNNRNESHPPILNKSIPPRTPSFSEPTPRLDHFTLFCSFSVLRWGPLDTTAIDLSLSCPASAKFYLYQPAPRQFVSFRVTRSLDIGSK